MGLHDGHRGHKGPGSATLRFLSAQKLTQAPLAAADDRTMALRRSRSQDETDVSGE